ncbi:glucose/arabinose dehydrogenase [Luteibacter sp. Sphag1AF]|uniref:DUF1592 domain-containing protein n=1 Tax=Luteibacter sp. Sphag1AF TaxID=2587031 RepID=UPI001609A136|nr:DUF1592 domain-containing protein [Luteibacter sp. Sphag1AF]MBB3228246.1 glucose/arabinose dehydrogenase [Luteibacter sp. Sphag1AF]
MKAPIVVAWVVLAVGALAGMASCSRNESGSSPTAAAPSAKAGGKSPRLACTAPEYDPTTHYQAGQEAQNVGKLFQCWKDEEAPLGPGSWAWCSQPSYVPGVPSPSGAIIWPDAWKDLGECGPTFEGNRLTIEAGSIQSENLSAPRETGHPENVSGVLRCEGEEHPFTAKWGDPIHIDKLKKCNYSLVMNAGEGYTPMNTPVMVPFTDDAAQEIKQAVTYRRSFDLATLSPLPGVKVELYAQGLLQPRQMALGKNTLFVGSSWLSVYATPIANMVYALPLDASHKPTAAHVVAHDQLEPHGVAFHDGALYFTTSTDVWRVNDAESSLDSAKAEKVLTLPPGGTLSPLPPPVGEDIDWHYWHQKHPIHFNPYDPADKGLYIAVGRPCNVCMMPKDPDYGTLLRYDLDTKKATILASGVRNASGFDWNPRTHEIWFDDNNRQGFANSEEVNRLAVQGAHFGAPYVFARNVIGFTDAEYADPKTANGGLFLPDMILSDIPRDKIDPSKYTPPAYEAASNAAPIGVAFWDGYPTPAGAEHLIVALHAFGSTEDPGLKLSMLTIKDNKVIQEIALVDGWLHDRAQTDAFCLHGCTGRPTDLLVLPDKSLLVSDDVAGLIYRITYDAAGVADSTLSLTSVPAPAPDVADAMISGVLVDARGHARNFHVAWDAPALELKGLPYGDYEVRLNDVGNWIPVKRTTKVTLSAEGKAQTVALAYHERPEHIAVKMTIHAPPKPATVTDAAWVVTVKTVATGAKQTVSVPWGGNAVHTLDYGKYQIVYPYFKNDMPRPALNDVNVNEETEDFALAPMAYSHTDDLGQAVLSEVCAQCHTRAFFDTPTKAHTWGNATPEAWFTQIQTMPFSGTHCDATCSAAVGSYLKTHVWDAYLNPGEAFGKRQLRQLTRLEYANTINDLFGIKIDVGTLPADKLDKTFKYPGEAELGILLPEDVVSYYNTARAIAEQVKPARLGYHTRADADKVVADLGFKVFRRPLTAEEQTRYRAILNEDGSEGLHDLVASMLLSPHFLYRSELGANTGTAPKAGEIYKLTPYELATALSYTFLGTTPSVELLHKAEQGLLDTPQQVGDEAMAMVRTERGIEQFHQFIEFYTRTMKGVQVKPQVDLTQPIIDAMAEEQYQFARHVLLDDKDTVNELFNPGYTYLNQVLAQHYGIAGITGPEMRLVPVDDKRGGLLHQGLTLAATSDVVATSLVKRGIMIREQFFCHEFGAPVEASPEPPNFPERAFSAREYWDLVNGEHASGGRCWRCHQFMNDTGSSMEHYDAAGRYRTEAKAYNYDTHPEMLPVNSAGPLRDDTGMGDWAQIQDVRGISALIPTNETALRCLADSYFRYAFGTRADANSAATVKDAAEILKTNGSIREMLRSLATTHALLYKKEGQ